MTDRNKTLAEVTDSNPTKNGVEHRKMTANTTISTKILVMSIRTLTVSFSGALMLISTRLAIKRGDKRRMATLMVINNRIHSVKLINVKDPIFA